MSFLGKFRMTGGFKQLVRLVELSEPAKQDSLIQMVGAEDPGWAHLLKLKILTPQRIFSWPSDILMKVFSPFSPEVLAAFYINCPEDLRGHIAGALTSRLFHEVQVIVDRRPPKEEEYLAARMKLLQTVREMEYLGMIDLANFDPALKIDTKLVS